MLAGVAPAPLVLVLTLSGCGESAPSVAPSRVLIVSDPALISRARLVALELPRQVINRRLRKVFDAALTDPDQ